MRSLILAEGEYYHIFNRGVEKRDIFLDEEDLSRFLEEIKRFQSIKPIGSLYEIRFHDKKLLDEQNTRLGSSASKPVTESPSLIELICYCLNPNHFHLLLKQSCQLGIQKYMQRLGTGYTNYFNEKYKRSGVLFQGAYRAVHVESNEQLLHTSVYVNLNDQLGSSASKLSRSSWEEYAEPPRMAGSDMCKKEIILGQFESADAYVSFAKDSFINIIIHKEEEKEMRWLLGSRTSKSKMVG